MKQLNRLLKHDLVVGLKNMKFEKDKLCSVCQGRKQVANAHPSKSVMSTERPLDYCIWIYLVLQHIEALEKIAIVLWLWMITQNIHGFFSS